MKDEMTDVEKLQKFWIDYYKEKPSTFKEFSKTMKIYKPKYKWQKILPFWILKLFVKPTSFYNCFPTQIESIVNTNNEFAYSVKFSYKGEK